jgi:hypothetical protein
MFLSMILFKAFFIFSHVYSFKNPLFYSRWSVLKKSRIYLETLKSNHVAATDIDEQIDSFFVEDRNAEERKMFKYYMLANMV